MICDMVNQLILLMLRKVHTCAKEQNYWHKSICSSLQQCLPQKDVILLHFSNISAWKHELNITIGRFYGMFVDIEIKISDDNFQAEHWLTDIQCTDPELYIFQELFIKIDPPLQQNQGFSTFKKDPFSVSVFWRKK